MIYLRQFETQAAYTAEQSSLILPNVSLVTENNTVHYNPLNPTPQHDYVEIGGVKWATMNVGATAVTDSGLYFQWGDTQGYTADQVGSGEGQKSFDWEDYKYAEVDTNGGGNGSGSGSGSGGDHMTKYNDTDGLITLQPSDDAVTAAWGGNWRMPTTKEFQALKSATTSSWTDDYEGSGVAGLVLTSNTDNSKKLFFPAADYASDGSVYDVGSDGGYWSSSLNADFDDSYAYHLGFGSWYVYWDDCKLRYKGYPVRGVVG